MYALQLEYRSPRTIQGLSISIMSLVLLEDSASASSLLFQTFSHGSPPRTITFFKIPNTTQFSNHRIRSQSVCLFSAHTKAKTPPHLPSKARLYLLINSREYMIGQLIDLSYLPYKLIRETWVIGESFGGVYAEQWRDLLHPPQAQAFKIN